MKRVFLLCGVLGVVIFILTTWIGGLITPNYNQLINAVSELTETGAHYGLILAIPYCAWDVCIILLFIGVMLVVDKNIIRVASIFQIANAFVAIFSYTVLTMDPPGGVHTPIRIIISILLSVKLILSNQEIKTKNLYCCFMG